MHPQGREEHTLNILRPEQNVQHFQRHFILKRMYFGQNLTQVWCQGPTDNESALVKAIAWCWSGKKSLPEPTMTQCADWGIFASPGLNGLTYGMYCACCWSGDTSSWRIGRHATEVLMLIINIPRLGTATANGIAPVHQQLQCCHTVYPKKYAHGFCFAVLCCGYTLTDFPISIRLTSLALWQSSDCPSASKATLMNMDKYFNVNSLWTIA